jgi:hypothetical protein
MTSNKISESMDSECRCWLLKDLIMGTHWVLWTHRHLLLTQVSCNNLGTCSGVSESSKENLGT